MKQLCVRQFHQFRRTIREIYIQSRKTHIPGWLRDVRSRRTDAPVILVLVAPHQSVTIDRQRAEQKNGQHNEIHKAASSFKLAHSMLYLRYQTMSSIFITTQCTEISCNSY